MLSWFDPTSLQVWLENWGPWASSVFVALQVLQVLVFWIPGDVVQFAGGVVFGTWGGTLLSSVGLAVGGLTAFLLSRTLGKVWVDRWLADGKHRVLESLVHHPRLELLLLLVFLVPVGPKDIFCYLAGLSSLKTGRFLVITTLARIPGLALSSWVGALAVHGFGLLFLGLLLVSSALGLAVFLYRKSLLNLLLLIR